MDHGGILTSWHQLLHTGQARDNLPAQVGMAPAPILMIAILFCFASLCSAPPRGPFSYVLGPCISSIARPTWGSPYRTWGSCLVLMSTCPADEGHVHGLGKNAPDETNLSIPAMAFVHFPARIFRLPLCPDGSVRTGPIPRGGTVGVHAYHQTPRPKTNDYHTTYVLIVCAHLPFWMISRPYVFAQRNDIETTESTK